MDENRTIFRIFTGMLIISCLVMFVIIGIFIYYKAVEPHLQDIAASGMEESDFHSLERPVDDKTSPVGSNTDEQLTVETEDAASAETILRSTPVTQNDPYALAEKYSGEVNVPVMLKTSPVQYQVGDERKFWVLNVDKNDYRQIDAQLAYQTAHTYFWVEEGISFKSEDIRRLADTFENQIYPIDRQIFGSEFTPGVDNDEHLTLLYAENLGGAAGYFSSADSYMSAIEEYSNVTEMFYLSADHVSLSNDYMYGVMAHEFQHTIHWNTDRDEASWINEGLSELAVDLNGFDLGGFSNLFIFNPDLQLNFWPGNEQGNSAPHYGASYLFIKYLYEQFGEPFIRSLVSEPQNGFSGVDAVVSSSVVDANISSLEIFRNWTLANFVNDGSLKEGEYGYGLNKLNAAVVPVESITCGDNAYSGTVNQFGADYLRLTCDRDYEVTITWNAVTPILPVDAHSGKYYFWSNRGDESDMRLFREFDFSGIEGPIEFSYWIWYDLESDYDYLYLNIFEDGQWLNLQPPLCTQTDPTSANYGCGYNGRSDGWIKETVDLSEFAGKNVTLEFEYITDAAVTGEGVLLDDLQIDAVNYSTDLEESGHGWDADGFVRIENELAQVFAVSLISSDGVLDVSKRILDKTSETSLMVENESSVYDEVLVLSGLTRFTHLPANYKVQITPVD